MPKKPRGEEHFHRINYLYKASELISNTSVPLAQYYGKVLKTVAEKTPGKITIEQKRSICKSCNGVLVLGNNATYRLKRKKGYKKNRKSFPTINITCKNCNTVKKFPTNPNFQLENGDNKSGSGSPKDVVQFSELSLESDSNSKIIKMHDSTSSGIIKNPLPNIHKKCSRIEGFLEYLF